MTATIPYFADLTTAAQLENAVNELIDGADIDFEEIDRNDDDDLGGWLNGTATLADGSAVSVGFWLWADVDLAAMSSDLADTLTRDGYALTPYDASDIGNGDTTVSDDLRAAFDRFADEDGQIWIDGGQLGVYVDTPEELLIACVAANPPGREQAEQLWADDIRRSIQSEIEFASVADLLASRLSSQDGSFLK